MSVEHVLVEADGGSRGNPGTAGYGAVVLDAATGTVLAERAAGLGVTTNNVAEYSGLIAGLEAAQALGARRVDVRMDSKLVIEQCSGRWQVKQAHLKPLVSRATELLRSFPETTLTWIPRAENSRADALANTAMDGNDIRRDQAAPEVGSTGTPPPSGPAVVRRAASEKDGGPGWRGGAQRRATTTVLVRHASSVLSPEKRFSGRGDVALSDDGVRQAERVAARLAARPGIDVVVSSPLRRARHTAELIAKAVGVPVEFDDDLVETDFGAWEGLTFSEARRSSPEAVDAWLSSPDVAPPGGESFAQVAERVDAARERLVADHAGETVVVVSHVTPLKTLLRLALEAPPVMLYRLQLDVTGVSEVDWYADGPANVRLVNDTHHLG
ncbi:bifunctional RNase H/acid phosphatase [Cryptosporangium phraense]|uniref:Bifunctional RNase H/acid phosphatase n=1 Tax=Cryptosporangium phraense TaxID=2593070 RepID=A0A545AV93_9ACTN|nr:bifunctional RNase H/acid phosphatase [Cryptosporangium phraense]TQS44515.1 bifunctional RNase H/acid phosphatase [Cryptosporangium phraense]